MRACYKQVSLFDLDGCLSPFNVSLLFLNYLFKHKRLSYFQLLKAYIYALCFRLGIIPLSQLHQQSFKLLFKGRPASLFLPLASRFLSDTFHRKRLYYPPAFRALKAALHRGDYCGICSSSPDFLVSALAKEWGLEGFLATQYLIDEKGLFSGLKIVDGKAKARYVEQIKQSMPLSKVNCYSDSFLDQDFLRASHQAVAVKPDRKLKKWAREHNCLII